MGITDSDIVTDTGKINFYELVKAFFGGGHLLYDSHQGWCEIVCLKSKRKYRHEIKCPNKNTLTCRGCFKNI